MLSFTGKDRQTDGAVLDGTPQASKLAKNADIQSIQDSNPGVELRGLCDSPAARGPFSHASSHPNAKVQ